MDGKEEDPLNITDYHIEVNSEDSSSNVMFEIEDGAKSTFCEELDVGERNINTNDDDDHCITYEIEELDVDENNMNLDDDGDHCITVTNENEPVSTRKFLVTKFYFHFFAA